MPALPDGPAILFIPQNNTFGSENVGFEIPATPYMTYSGGGAAQASGQSSFIGQITINRYIQPFNQCSGSIPTPPGATPINLAY
jgi:hypothetical protein